MVGGGVLGAFGGLWCPKMEDLRVYTEEGGEVGGGLGPSGRVELCWW